MQLTCPSCARTLDYSGDRPRFCSHCGTSLSASSAIAAAEERTAPPSRDGDTQDAPTAPPDAWGSTEALAAGRPRPRAEVPETIGGYRLLQRLGGGGMGAVYEAEESATGRRVALKLILPEIAGTGDALVRFRQEGQLASAVAHPRCVFVLAADEDAGRPYIVMELMPGATLSDLVRERGPLPPEEAVAKIIDVIDGLSEAHRRGLVHRDVKPSNCFLEASGRVKIGDFGLARSLVVDSKLTRTGAFVGTPLYAAPEQIHKKDPTDAQSDVYSVAATLYFLLAGRAPFQTGDDAVATMARIVTDNPPSLRMLQPKLPKALDRAVLRGLERDRRRRYRDLEEMRRALLQFLPAESTVGGLGLRFAAELIDLVVRTFVGVAAGFVVLRPLIWLGLLPELPAALSFAVYGQALGLLIVVLYYGVCEGTWGCALGKWLLRLRVGTSTSVQPPGLWRAAGRATLFYLVFQLGWLVNQSAPLFIELPVLVPGQPIPPEQASQWMLIGLLLGSVTIGVFVLSLGLNFGVMRARTGYRALHELLSGTRTYRLRWPGPRPRRALQRRTFELALSRPDDMPARIGAFRVQSALRWTKADRVLVAEDPQLNRPVWLWLRPASAASLAGALRDVNRVTRVRWSAGGVDGAWQWDAFVAPAGMPLPALAAGTPRLSWGEVRPILEDLTEELDAACVEGTLPASLSVTQVWVQPNGRAHLLPIPLEDSDDEPSDLPADDEQRALRLLADSAVTALEGHRRPIEAEGDAVRAPVPLHAQELLGRLLGGPRRFRSLVQVRRELESTRDQPVEVSRWRRAGHLAVTALLMNAAGCVGPAPLTVATLALIPLIVTAREPQAPDPDILGFDVYLGLCCAFWAVWAFVFRGGYSYWRGGIYLRRADGRKVARWQCAVRAALVWGPLGLLYCSAIVIAYQEPFWPWLYFGLWGLGTALLPLSVVLALLYPNRSLHDRIAGTYLVPA